MKLIVLKEYDEATCSKCRLTKPKDQFYNDDTRFNGMSSYCKSCRRKLNNISSKKYRDIKNPNRKRRV